MSRSEINNKRPRKQAVLDDQSLNFLIMILGAILLLLLITGAYFIAAYISGASEGEKPGGDVNASTGDYPFRQEIDLSPFKDAEDLSILEPISTSDTGIYSDFAVLVDLTSGEILASRKAEAEIYPASMVKVMSLIVAVENLKTAEAMYEKLTISQEIVNSAEGSSGFGFQAGEVLTVKELLHALILQSDGIAALTLAEYTAGSESAFVELMNQKAQELGMVKTQFQNCTGLEHDYMISTCKDVAVMMSYAMKNSFCAEILSTKSLVLSSDFRNGVRHILYHKNLQSEMDDTYGIHSQLDTVKVKAAKSGWIGNKSGYCLVNYAEGENGHKYILVTAKVATKDAMYKDLVYIYNNYAK